MTVTSCVAATAVAAIAQDRNRVQKAAESALENILNYGNYKQGLCRERAAAKRSDGEKNYPAALPAAFT
jgi:hypothetical protein